MTLPGLLSSPSQKKSFLLSTSAVLVISILCIIAVSAWSPDTRIWNSVNSLLISIVASGVFAIVASLYITYFFVDPKDIELRSILLPNDIGDALKAAAEEASNYQIFVRTGRHFRAEILPALVKQAVSHRRPVRIEAIVLDLRDDSLCDEYASFRKTASFDKKVWGREYVQTEIMSTIIALINASNESGTFISIDVYLSKRLSTFRIEGSSEEIIVTREDPKDTASRYLRPDRDHAAFETEMSWIRKESKRLISASESGQIEIEKLFPENKYEDIIRSAKSIVSAPSPYAR